MGVELGTVFGHTGGHLIHKWKTLDKQNRRGSSEPGKNSHAEQNVWDRVCGTMERASQGSRASLA